MTIAVSAVLTQRANVNIELPKDFMAMNAL